ncbi:hypothetical protein TNCV_512611 [Trichonephila clavipes]|nr:hypothetical protein TNCV_512611 [Trichonephila clavipes]
MYTNCSSEPASPTHILECLGAHQARFSRQSLAGVGFFESVGSHGPGLALLTNGDKFDDDIQKVTPARAPLAFSLLSNSALMSKSFSFDLLRLRAKTAWLWLPQSASLTVRCPQRYVHRDQRRI